MEGQADDIPLPPEAQAYLHALQQPAEPVSQAFGHGAQSLGSGTFMADASESPTLFGSENLDGDVDMKSLSEDDATDASSSRSNEHTPAIVPSQLSLSPYQWVGDALGPDPLFDVTGPSYQNVMPDLGSDASGWRINPGTGEVLDPLTGIPLSPEELFGIPASLPERDEGFLDEFFTPPTPAAQEWFPSADQPVSTDWMHDDNAYDFMHPHFWPKAC